MRLLLAKARHDWARWQTGLSPIVQLVMRDPWRLTVRPETPESKTLWLNLDEFQGVICVSPMAARQLTQALDTYWPQPPAGIAWLCNGPATAEVLRQAGLVPQYPGTGHTAEDVLSLPSTEAVNGGKWLVVKGAGGRDVYPSELANRGAQVTALETYDRALDPKVLSDMAELAPRVDGVLVSSVLLGEALVSGGWRQWPGTWVLTSPRLQGWARSQGLRDCIQAEGASPEAVCRALKAAGDKVDR